MYKVTSSTVYTIEGNSGNAVRKKSYLLTDSYIKGYGRPKYESIKMESDELTDETGSDDKYMFSVETVKAGSSGKSVLLLQRLLRAGGFKGADNLALTLDGECGNNTVAAIKKYQKKKKLTQDGVAGPTTWKTILGL